MRRASRMVVSQVAKGNSSAKGHTGILAFMLAKVGKYSIGKQKTQIDPFRDFCVSCSVEGSRGLFHHQLESYAVYILDVDLWVILEILAQLGDIDVH